MRKIVLAAATASAAFALSSCGSAKKPVEEKAETPVAPQSLSAADKTAVDALGNDLNKLVEAVDSSTGSKQVYAEEKLVEAFNTSKDTAGVDTALGNLRKPGAAKIAGMAAQVRLKK